MQIEYLYYCEKTILAQIHNFEKLAQKSRPLNHEEIRSPCIDASTKDLGCVSSRAPTSLFVIILVRCVRTYFATLQALRGLSKCGNNLCIFLAFDPKRLTLAYEDSAWNNSIDRHHPLFDTFVLFGYNREKYAAAQYKCCQPLFSEI